MVPSKRKKDLYCSTVTQFTGPQGICFTSVPLFIDFELGKLMKKSDKKAEWVGSFSSNFNPGRLPSVVPECRASLPLGLTLWRQDPLLGAGEGAAKALL